MIFKKEHELLRKTVKDFVEREMADYPEQVDETNEIPQDVIDKLVKYKFVSPIIPKEFGGAGADYVSYVIIGRFAFVKFRYTGTERKIFERLGYRTAERLFRSHRA